MTDEQVHDALDGIYAYDNGSVSSGIRDELLRARVKEHLNALTPETHQAFLAGHVIRYFLGSEALGQGYGPEDAKGFLNWCDEQGILL